MCKQAEVQINLDQDPKKSEIFVNGVKLNCVKSVKIHADAFDTSVDLRLIGAKTSVNLVGKMEPGAYRFLQELIAEDQ